MSSRSNEHSPVMHRREADWVALVFADVAGRTPNVPWTVHEITATSGPTTC